MEIADHFSELMNTYLIDLSSYSSPRSNLSSDGGAQSMAVDIGEKIASSSSFAVIVRV
jgi:hypothetical protein